MVRCGSFICLIFLTIALASDARAQDTAPLWGRFEQAFTSSRTYDNPLYDLRRFSVRFTSPTGRTATIHGFWDGGATWRVRFMPDEAGAWSWVSEASDTTNGGLHRISGRFTVSNGRMPQPFAAHGAITRPRGAWHLNHADGTPFFWAACTAWNGAIRSTDEEWHTYLDHRARNGYSVIQFVTTPWRGADRDELGQVAFEGSGRIRINAAWFQRLDRKFDEVNARGLVAAPVLLWALPTGAGRELSPGYYLPDAEAILLARYMVARYGAHHVVWILGGDGNYRGEYEQRWKTIGRGVFGDDPPGVVATHSQGRSWIGQEYARGEEWLDVIGYQSSHNSDSTVVSWMTRGPMSREWHQLPPRPLINMEPAYEEHQKRITDADVRRASYWSLFATPVAGITYGASGIWPWLRMRSEAMLNHGAMTGFTPWREALDLPGSRQIGLLAGFMRSLEWWRFRPAQQLLVTQPGDTKFDRFVSVVANEDWSQVLVYMPAPLGIELRNPSPGASWHAEWFNPVNGERQSGIAVPAGKPILGLANPLPHDAVLILSRR